MITFTRFGGFDDEKPRLSQIRTTEQDFGTAVRGRESIHEHHLSWLGREPSPVALAYVSRGTVALVGLLP